MAWITPKTDWAKSDYFTYVDYNRIRNNLLYINDTLNEKYPDVAQTLDLGDELSYVSNYLPSQFNAFEDALESFKRIGKNVNIGDKKTFYGNASFIDFKELNRIESCCLKWYNLTPVIESVAISPNAFELNQSETQQLTLNVIPSDAEYTVVWSSSDETVVTVTQNGLVTAVSNGNFTITATVSQAGRADKNATANGVVVIPVTGLSLSFKGENITNDIVRADGVTTYVNVAVIPNNATHKGNWQFEVGEGQYGAVSTRVFKETDTKLGIEYRYSNSDEVWDDYNDVYCYCSLNNTKHVPVTVSLDGFSQTFYITLRPRGTYSTNKACTEHSALAFRLLKKGASASSRVHLNFELKYFKDSKVYDTSTQWIDSYDDRECDYRNAINKYMSYHFSSQMAHALENFPKYVYAGENTTDYYTAKYHLLSLNEIGGYVEGNLIPALGDDTYPYIISSNKIYLYDTDTIMSRSRGFSGGTYSISMDDSSIGSYYGVGWTGIPAWGYILPIINIVGSLRVKFLRTLNNTNYYEFDWSGQSSTRVYDIPLGSVIYDLTGERGEERLYYAESIIAKDNGVECSEITLAVGESKTLDIEVHPSNYIFPTAFINYNRKRLSVTRSNNSITITRTDAGNDIISFVISDATWYVDVK